MGVGDVFHIGVAEGDDFLGACGRMFSRHGRFTGLGSIDVSPIANDAPSCESSGDDFNVLDRSGR